MWKKLKCLILEMEKFDIKKLSDEDRERITNRLLNQIAFFQHERLVHLIVTVAFAIMTMIDLVIICVDSSIGFIVLEVLFIALLIPYVIHYYRLENGVQKLYSFYEKLSKKED